MLFPIITNRIIHNGLMVIIPVAWVLTVMEPLAAQSRSSLDPSVLNADEPEPVSDQENMERVERWVDSLGASSSIERRRAERSLLEAGPSILPWLPEKLTTESAEANERLARIRKILLSQRQETQSFATSTMIDFSGVSKFGEALERLGLDTGVTFSHPIDEESLIEPISATLPFWHALDLLLDQKELDVNFYGGSRNEIQLIRRRDERPSRVDSAAYSSMYRIEPVSVNARRTLRSDELGGMSVAVEISWEPQLTPIGLTFPLQELELILDDGATLKPQASGGTIDVATTSELAFSECSLPFQLPSGRPHKISSLHGVVRALVPSRPAEFQIPLISGTGKVTIDEMTVSLDSIRQNNELYQLVISVELENAGRALESHRQWIFENNLFLKRKDGSRVEHLGYEVLQQTESGVSLSYLFDLDGGPESLSLVYQSPTSVSSSEVKFELKEIPLP